MRWRWNPGGGGKTLTDNYFRKVNAFSVQTYYGGEGYLIVNGIEIKQTREMEHMLLWSGLLIGFAHFIWQKLKEKERLKHILLWGMGIAAIVSIPTMMPYLYEGDDLYFHLLRIEGIAEGLRTGQFPVRIQPEWMNGYGYPVSIFYGDGILWIAGILRILGFPLQLSYKIYLYLINALTFGIAFWSFKRIVKDDKIAVIGGILYTLAPYRLMNIYVRGAVGEYTALTFLPLILVAAYEILMEDQEKRRYSWLLLAVGMTGIIQSHILTCEIVVFVLGVTCLVCWKRVFEKERLREMAGAVILTVLINFGFLLPFLDYMREDLLVNSAEFDGYIQTSGTFLNQLFALFPHAYGASISIVDGLSGNVEKAFCIGAVFLFAMIIFVIDRKKNWNEDRNERKLGSFCGAMGAVLLFMSTIWFPWDFLNDLGDVFGVLISRLQFPWRFLGTAGCLLSAVACIVLMRKKESGNEKELICCGLIMLGLTAITTGYFITSLIEKNDVIYVADIESFSTFEVVGGEYLPVTVDRSEGSMPKGKIWHNEMVEIVEQQKEGAGYFVNCVNSSSEIQYIEVPLIYYRGYDADDLSHEENIYVEAGDNGRVRVQLPGNYQGTLKVQFKEPVLWRISELISALTIAVIIIYFAQKMGWNKKAEHKNEK